MSPGVYFLLLPNVLSLDVSGPAETLRLAGQFSLRYLSPAPQIVCSIGMTLATCSRCPNAWKTAPFCAAGRRRFAALFRREEAEQARRWLATLRPICSGSASPWCASVPARCWRRRPGASTAISAPPHPTSSNVSAGRHRLRR